MELSLPSQLDKFNEAARQLETDDEQRFKEKLGKLMKFKPKPGEKSWP